MMRDDVSVTATSSVTDAGISVRIRAIRRGLVTVVLSLGVFSAIGLWANTQFGAGVVGPDVVDLDVVGKVARWFDLNKEVNVPTWFSVMLLATAGVLAMGIGLARHSVGTTRPHQWVALSILFAGLSFDEMAQLHEEFNNKFDLGGIFLFAWVIPGALFVLVVGGVFLPFLRALPQTYRWGIIAAGALFVSGAIGLELIEAALVSARDGDRTVLQQSVGYVQELMEMLAIVWFLDVLLHVFAARPPIRVIVSE